MSRQLLKCKTETMYSLVWLEISRQLGVYLESQFKSGASQAVGAEHMGLSLAGTSAYLPSWEMERAESQ